MTIERLVEPTFSEDEAQALLWAVRNLSLDALQDGPYHGPYDRAVGHGALSSATNRLERALGYVLRKRRRA